MSLGKKGFFDTIFSGTQAVCALILTGFATWGVFFTDLPEVLVKQLRSDIAKSQEELIDVRRNLRAVEFEYAVANEKREHLSEKLSESEVEISRKLGELEKLEKKRVKLESRLREVQQARVVYFRQIYSTVASDIVKNVKMELQEAQKQALRASQYVGYKAWLQSGMQIMEEQQKQRKKSRNLRLKNIDTWYEWVQKCPPGWSNVPMQFIIRSLSKERPENSERLDDAAKALRDFDRLITSPRDSITGEDIVMDALNNSPLYLLLKPDQKKIRLDIQEFMNKHSASFSGSVRISVPRGASDDFVVQRGVITLEELDKFQLAVHLLDQYLQAQ